MSFKPFHDYDQLDAEQAEALKEALARYRKAQDDLLAAHTADRQITCAQRLLEANQDAIVVIEEINKDIYTVPALVHTAGEVELEQHEEFGMMLYMQRCERCGSVLHASSSEDRGFFEEGDRIAKRAEKKLSRKPSRRAMMMIPDLNQMYFVGDRDLEKHELECVPLKSIFGEA